MEGLLLIFALVMIPAIWLLMLLTVMWYRMERYLGTQDPPRARLVIHSFGADGVAMARALARYTRLDLNEIDELLDERRTGALPLPLSWHRARVLAAELRSLGASVEVESQ